MKEKHKIEDRTDFKFLEKFEGELNKISVRNRVPVEDIKEIVFHFFKTVKDWITDPRMPTIRITNLGTFKPSYAQIGRSLKRSIKCYRLGQTKPERLRRLIRDIWPIRKRLQKERNQEITWKEWRKMELIEDPKTGTKKLPLYKPKEKSQDP